MNSNVGAPRGLRGRRWLVAAAGAIAALHFGFLSAGWAQGRSSLGQTVGPSGLPLPRFASLKADKVNLRQGPGTDYPTAWVYQRIGLPVEVMNEFETWRQIRDTDGATGWVLATMLSGRRTALVLPWEISAKTKHRTAVTMRDDDSSKASPVAHVEAGVLVYITSCDGAWCRVSAEGTRGYIEQSKLWGAYQGEVIK